VHPAAEYEPAWVAVALQVPAEGSHREHGVSRTWSFWKRFPGDSHQDLELLRRERARGRRTLFRAGKMPKEE